MKNYVDIRLSNEDIQNFDIAFLPEDIKIRYSQSFSKYGKDEEFFFTVYSVAVTDWVLSKQAGKSVKSVSSFLSSYLNKENKRREKNTDVVSRKKAGEDIFPGNGNAAETAENTDDLDFLDNIEKKTEFLSAKDKKENVYTESDTGDDEPEEPSSESFSNSENTNFLKDDRDGQPPVQDSNINDDNDEPETASTAFLDLISDDEPEEIYEDEKELELQDFEKHGKKRSSLIISFIVLFSVIIVAGIFVAVNGGKKKPEKIENPIEDFEEYGKNRVSNVENAMNKGEEEELKEQKKPVEEKKISTVSNSSSSGIRKSGSPNKNTVKDEEILEKYSGANAGAEVVQARRKGFKPGGSQKEGGVYIKGTKSDKPDSQEFIHKNIKIKVKLQFSIRSTASTTVVAVVTQGTEQVPEGSKFYGNASGYANSRTQIRFSKLLSAGQEFSINGFAISGQDPGIPSEVTDVSGENIKAGVKQGIGKTAANILQNVTSRVSGGVADASSNTTDPVNAEYQQKEEANKMTQEYRVPAGTGFYIYLE